MKIKEIKKRQHTIPRLYLEGFCDRNDMIWTYSKNDPQPYPRKPENVSIENFFYTFHGASIDPNTFEDALESIVETPAATPLKQLRECKLPSSDDRQRLAILFGFMLVRTPSYRNTSDDLINKGLNLRLQKMAEDMGSFRKSWQEYNEKHAGVPFPEDFKALRESILKGDFKIELNPNYSLLVIQKLGLDFSFLLSSMKWMIYKTTDNINFVTADNPVLIESGQFDIFNPSFLLATGSRIFIPISKSAGLAMVREKEETSDTEIVAANPDTVIQLNKKLCANAKRYVYASENNDVVKDYLKMV